MRYLLATLVSVFALLTPVESVLAGPATAYQMTPDHAGVTTSGGRLALQEAPLWSVDLGGPISYPLIVDGRIFVTAAGLLHAFDATSGARLWGPTVVPGAVAPTYDSGRIVVVSNSGLLSSFDAATGSPGWSVQLSQYSFSSAPTAHNGIVYVGGGGSGGTLYAVNITNGAMIWTQGVANGDNSSPAIGPDAVYVSYACMVVYSFNLTTGNSNWVNTTGCSGGGGNTSVYAGGRLYARDGFFDGQIFNAQTGAVLGSFASQVTPAIGATRGYFLSNGTLRGVNLSSNAVLWSFAGDGTLSSSPMVVDDTVIIGSTSGFLYGLNSVTGRVTWQVSVGSSIPSGNHWFSVPTAFAAADGVLAVPTSSRLVVYSIFGPPAPSDLTATARAGAVQLSWTAAAGAQSYNVYMGSLSDAQALIPVQTNVTGTSTLVTNLPPGTTYFFRVKAVNSTGISAPTNEASAIPFNPSPPTGVTASAGVARVALSWAASQDAISYNVFMGTASGAQSSVPVATGLTGTSVTITSLTPNVNYFFTVRSIAYTAVSNASSEASATPTTAPPPANLSAAAGVGSAALAWTASSTATSYNVYMGTSSAGQSPTPIQSGLSGTGTTITGLNPSTRYYFVVRSVVSGVAGSASNEAAVTPLPTPVPQNLTAVAGFGQIGLGWTAAPTATSYNVYSGGCPLGQPANATLSGVTGVSATIPNLTPGVQYCFTVRAVGPAGMSAPTAEVSATPQRYPGPANLVATPGIGQVALAWSASPSATAYDIYMGSSAGQQGTSPVQTVSGTAATVTGLSSPNTYYFVVVAQTPIGASLRSAEVSARPLVPPGPTNLAANPDRGQVSLTWSGAANAQSYSVFMGATSGGQSATPVQTGITGLSTIVAGLTSNNNYFFFVRAETTSGPSQNSNEVSARPLAPVGPTGLAATPGQNQVALTWNPVAGAISYSVYVGTSSGGQSTTPTLTNVLGTSGTVTGLTNGSNYFFVVRAETSGGLSAASNEVSATPVAPPSPPPSSNSGGGGGGAFDLLTLLALTLAGIVGAFVRTSPRRDP